MLKAVHKTCGIRKEIGDTSNRMKTDWEKTWDEAYMYWSYRLLMLFACVSCVMFIIVDSLNLCLRGERRAGAGGLWDVCSSSQHNHGERPVARECLRDEVPRHRGYDGADLGHGQELPGCMSKD